MAGMPDPTTLSQGGFPTRAGLTKLGQAVATVAKERVVDPVVNTAKVIDSVMREQTPIYVADDAGNVTFNPAVSDAVMNTALGMTGGAGMIPAEANSLRMGAKGIRGWHASPYDFDRFDLSKVGTGIGANTRGHGVYIASAEPDAKYFLDQVKKESDKGRMYEVNINAQPNQFLDWDKLVSEQPEFVQQVLSKLGVTDLAEQGGVSYRQLNKQYGIVAEDGKIIPASKDYAESVQLAGGDRQRVKNLSPVTPQAQSQTLLREGVKGIKYSSPTVTGESQSPSDNYVVFDDKIIDILRKYGLIGTAGALGYGLMEPNSAQAAPQAKGMMQGARDAVE